MALQVDLVAAVLLSALLHALWNSFVKVSDDRLVSIAVIVLTGGALSAPWIFTVPLPVPASWGFVAASVTMHLTYYYFLINAYRFGDLSRVYPLARGLAPAMVALAAALLAGEWLSLREVAGVVLVSLGIASLVAGARGAADRRGLWFATATGATIAIYTVIDGLGGRSTDAVLSYIVWLNLSDALVILVVARWRRGPILWPLLRAAAPRGAIAGAMATLGYGIVIYAMSRGAMAHVSALRETSVVIAALIGTLLLGEPGLVPRVGAAALVALGVIVMNWSA
ncbi:MAG: EamA family transporter [Candidatus Binatia bacterium]